MTHAEMIREYTRSYKNMLSTSAEKRLAHSVRRLSALKSPPPDTVTIASHRHRERLQACKSPSTWWRRSSPPQSFTG